jgi:diguanylate cyclase (GGDEF)-like protein
MFRTSNASIWFRLAASIWIGLVLTWCGVIVWDGHRHREVAVAQAADFSMAVHDSTLAGLTAMMITETMDRADVLLDQIKELDVVRDLRVVPGPLAFDGVESSQKSAKPKKRLTPDPAEALVLATGQPVSEVLLDARGSYLRSIRPTRNSERYLGKNCVECHDAPVNAILGVISVRISLDRFDRAIEQQQRESLLIALGASLILLGFIWLLVRAARSSLADAETKASTDVLTGLPNRRGFMHRMEVEFELVKAGRGRTACVMMVDLDHFKRINDNFGHAAGDDLLRRLGQILREQCRGSDVAGRVGGEEFAILLRDTNESGGRSIAERLRKAIEAAEVVHETHLIHMTGSIGLSDIRPDDSDPDQSLARADHALYRAKSDGRNRVVTTAELLAA